MTGSLRSSSTTLLLIYLKAEQRQQVPVSTLKEKQICTMKFRENGMEGTVFPVVERLRTLPSDH